MKIYVSKDVSKEIAKSASKIKAGKVVEFNGIKEIDGMDQFEEYEEDKLFLSEAKLKAHKSCMAKTHDTRLDSKKKQEIDKLIKECDVL